MPPRRSSTVVAGGVGLRRNGKQQACEPCRKGKYVRGYQRSYSIEQLLVSCLDHHADEDL